jgi:hypothetical protein
MKSWYNEPITAIVDVTHRRSKMKTYSFVNKSGTYTFAKQESIVFQALRNVGVGTIEELAAECVHLGLKTRQDPERIVSYYLVSLRKAGLVESSGESSRRVTVEITEEAAA